MDFKNDPSWANAGWLALDVVFAVVPVLTGSSALKASSKTDDITDIARLTTNADNVIVIGQSMKTRVIPEALNLGVDYYHGFLYYDDIAKGSVFMARAYGYLNNMVFVAMQSMKGTRFIDVGMDITRIGEKGLWFSKATIYSERFIAQTFRFKNLMRVTYKIGYIL